MNRNLILAVAGVGAVSIALTGCSGKSSSGVQYDVRGTVLAKQTEYECESHSLGDSEMQVMSYGDKGGTTGSRNSNENPGSKNSDNDSSDSGLAKDADTSGSAGGTGLGSGSSATTPAHKNIKGSDTKSSPSPTKNNSRPPSSADTSKPVKIPRSKIPTGRAKKPRDYDSKWCEAEYELFIEDKNNDVFELDVPYAHYAKCDEKERFDSCV